MYVLVEDNMYQKQNLLSWMSSRDPESKKPKNECDKQIKPSKKKKQNKEKRDHMSQVQIPRLIMVFELYKFSCHVNFYVFVI